VLQETALDTAALLNHGSTVDLVEFDVPELDNPIHMGAAVAIVYRDSAGDEWMHEFKPGAELLVDDGIAVVVDPGLTVDDLGIEEGTD
jgi:hypothetical protein